MEDSGTQRTFTVKKFQEKAKFNTQDTGSNRRPLEGHANCVVCNRFGQSKNSPANFSLEGLKFR